MKPHVTPSRTALLCGLCLALAGAAQATTIIWTNTAGGDWTTATNWSPNQVPGSSDTTFITNSGTYTVTLSTSISVAGITLGTAGGSGTPTLAWTGDTLSGCALSVAGNGVLNLSGAADKTLVNSRVNNAGTVAWSGTGGFRLELGAWNHVVLITNLAGGVFDLQSDASLTYINPGYEGPALLHNAGTLRKSGGTGTSSFGSGIPFINTGTVALQQGTVQFLGGFTSSGAFDLAAGTAVRLAGGTFNFGVDSLKTGAGELLVDSGSVTVRGTMPSLVWAGGVLTGSDITVASNATLTLRGEADKTLIYSTVNNAGTVAWSGTGALRLEFGEWNHKVMITNLAGGVFDLQSDASLTYVNAGSAGPALLHNAGTLRKSGGTGTSSFAAGIPFINTGTVALQQGAVQFLGGFTSSGAFDLAAGTTVRLAGGTFNFGVDSLKTGAGELLVDSGSVTVRGTVPSLVWAGGVLTGSDITVASNATLTLRGGADKTLIYSTVNNAGTVAWSGTGALRLEFSAWNHVVQITNLAGGVFDLQSDASLTYVNAGSAGPALLHNAGTLRKSGGTGTSSFAAEIPFLSSGQMDVQTGSLELVNPTAQISGGLSFGITSPTVFGKLSIPSTASVRGVIRAALVNPSGLSAGDSFAVLNRGSDLAGPVVFAGRNLGNGLVYDPVWSDSALTLVLRAATHPTPPVVSGSFASGLPSFVLVEGEAGRSFRFDASADLSAWTPLATNSAPAGVWEWSDAEAPGFERRFYRAAVQQP